MAREEDIGLHCLPPTFDICARLHLHTTDKLAPPTFASGRGQRLIIFAYSSGGSLLMAAIIFLAFPLYGSFESSGNTMMIPAHSLFPGAMRH
ncbi:hypothetical protein GDO81_028962 [Engystomops pustulosus]|uniref:Uncharacterized protein n=1 Tax=Engystomops pustulosus TaxID=76066 RepID=A0AAV6ZL77_ENGPU|nr:hypothetical protein GDO81_028962 [Engystomops pustulosus]